MKGFTLVEVLVSLVVLEVALLGTLAMVVVANRTMDRAWALEAGVASLEGVADSLVAVGVVVEGERAIPEGNLSWRPALGGSADLTFTTRRGDTVRVTVVTERLR